MNKGVKIMRVVKVTVWGCLILMMFAGFTLADSEKEAMPVIEVEMPTYDFDQVFEGEVVKHDFRVFNRGSAPLKIKNVKPG
jgi:hypothetical protein